MSETIPSEKESEKNGVSVDESSLMVVSKQPRDMFDLMMRNSVKASVTGCFGEWRTMTVSSFVQNIFQQNVKLEATNGKNPLKLKKTGVNDNNPSESRKAVKFIASFCQNEEEYLQLVSLKNISDVFLERMKAARVLGNKLEERVKAWCDENVTKKKPLKLVKLGALGKNIIKSDLKIFHFKVAHKEQWNEVKKLMMNKFDEDNEKANESSN